MERRSPTAAVIMELVLALGCLTTHATGAPYTLVANVVSHFVVHEGGSTVLKQPQVDVQCSALPGVQCRSVIRNNQLIVNVYQDDYRSESAQSFKDSKLKHEDNTVVPFRWSDRMSRKSNINTKHLHEVEQTSTQHGNIFDEDVIQSESLQQTSYEQDRSDNTRDDFQDEMYDSSDTNFEKINNFENSAEEVTNQVSELEHDEEQSEDNEYSEVLQIPFNNNNELSNDKNTFDNSGSILKVSRSGKTEESNFFPDNTRFLRNNENKHSLLDSEENYEEEDYGSDVSARGES